jgi:ABC-type glycerol-3-phosphate transport system substrate-binding protein
MSSTLLTRRTMLKGAALATTTLAAPFVRGAYAAGKLSFGVWDHWVPGASEVLGMLCREWAEKEKVDLTFDLITSNGDKDLLTLMAEGQARTGHDIMGLRVWYVSAQADNFVPLDDVVDPLIQKYGNVSQACEYLGKIKGHWMAVPTCYGSAAGPSCARIDLFKEYLGLDVQKMYPVGPPDTALTDQWTWDYLLTASEKCVKAGKPFGIGLSTCTDAINMAGSVFTSFGADLVDAEGTITVKTDATRQVLEWFLKLAKTLPDSVYAYDNASNNKALISGQSALIFNAPSAYAVARRDNIKVAEQCWTFPSPKGPKGRFDNSQYYYWGIWNFSKNIPAAKSLLAHLTARESQEKLVTASVGFDIPTYDGMKDFKVWDEVEPPKGTLYNYPPRGDVISSIAGYPAPLKIGTQMWAQATHEDDRPVHAIRQIHQRGDGLGRERDRRLHAVIASKGAWVPHPRSFIALGEAHGAFAGIALVAVAESSQPGGLAVAARSGADVLPILGRRQRAAHAAAGTRDHLAAAGTAFAERDILGVLHRGLARAPAAPAGLPVPGDRAIVAPRGRQDCGRLLSPDAFERDNARRRAGNNLGYRLLSIRTSGLIFDRVRIQSRSNDRDGDGKIHILRDVPSHPGNA